jgi:CHAT domain-containing protein/tetratricopeptide (TPR) repeat protein
MRRSFLVFLVLLCGLSFAYAAGADESRPSNAPSLSPQEKSLADDLLAAPDSAKRLALLKSHRDLITPDFVLRFAIHTAPMVDKARSAGRFDEALRITDTLFQAASFASPNVDADDNVGYCFLTRGQILSAMADYRGALECFRKTLEISVKSGSRLLRGLAHLSIAQSLVTSPDLDYNGIEEHVRKALLYLEAAEDARDIVRALAVKAMIAGLRGNLEEAERIYLRMQKKAHDIGDLWGEASAVVGRFGILTAVARYSEAEKSMEEAVEMSVKMGNRGVEAVCRNLLGEVQGALGKYEKAVQNFSRSLEICRDLNQPLGSANALMMRGWLFLASGKNPEALDDFTSAQGIYRKIGLDMGVWWCDLRRGLALLALGRDKEAEESVNKALPYFKKSRLDDELSQCHGALGQVSERRDQLDDALAHYTRAVEIVERVRSRFTIEEYKTGYLEHKLNYYEALIRVLLKMHRDLDAFNVAERSRARAFLDMLGNRRIDVRKGVSEPLLRKEQELSLRINELENRRRGRTAGASLLAGSPYDQTTVSVQASITTELEKLRLSYEETLSRIKLECNEYAQMVSVAPPPAAEIQSALDGGTALLAFFLGHEASCLFLMDRDKVSAVPLPARGTIEDLVEAVREGIRLRTPRWIGPARGLHDMIFTGKVRDFLAKKKRLLIVAHGKIHYLPFACLPDENGAFLIERYALVDLPSAGVFRFCREKPRNHNETMAAFAIGSRRVAGFSPLEGTVEEVESLRDLFACCKVFREESFTRSAVMSEAPKAAYLHFATHGHYDRQFPLFSYLLLGDERDPRLNVERIFGLDLKANLVVLSACETGLGGKEGKPTDGDEIVGLARAFIYAGTPSLVSSLWSVNDRSTRDLMKSFYVKLKSADKAEALRQAQLDMIRSADDSDFELNHPFYWAPFVLTGDYR